MAKVVFKEFSGTQPTLFPQNILDKIAPNHPVRLVNEVVDNLEISNLISKYKGGGK